MKRIINKIKNIFLTVGVFLLTGKTEVLGAQTDYGVLPIEGELVEKRPTINFIQIIKFMIIPLVFIIGSIIYLNKSKSNKTSKIITLLIALLLTIGIYFGINYVYSLHY